jgi:hypothetical protein
MGHHPRQLRQRREQQGFPYRQLNESSGKIFGGAMHDPRVILYVKIQHIVGQNL